MKTSPYLLAVALLLPACSAPVDVTPTVSKTGAWIFPAANVQKVIFRAGEAKTAVVSDHANSSIDVSATCEGGALGYHSPDPSWKETSAEEWGMEFLGRQYGKTLVISSRNEISYIHHQYSLTNISIAKPAGVRLIIEPRILNGDGAPNLRR